MSTYNDKYFQLGAAQADRATPGVFFKLDDVIGLQAAEGLVLKPVTGGNLMCSFVFMEPNRIAPEHAHPEEQMGFIIDGEYEFEMNGVKRMCRRGDIYYVPPNVPHSARTYDKPCFAVDVFTPPRKNFDALPPAKTEAKRDG